MYILLLEDLFLLVVSELLDFTQVARFSKTAELAALFGLIWGNTIVLIFSNMLPCPTFIAYISSMKS